MRITSGDYRFRKLEVPEGIRPTTEKVREAIFSMIREWNFDTVFVDMFAGSGALGLEALSRGAAKCYFNEGNRRNYKILLDNINNCKAGDYAVVSNSDFRKFIMTLSEPVDVVLMDPPYEAGYYEEAMELLLEQGVLDEGSIVVAEHLYDNELSETYGNLRRIKTKKYGTIGVDIYLYEIANEEQ